MRGIAAILVGVSVLVCAVASGPAWAGTPPQLAELTVTPTTFDTSTGNNTITVDARVTDADGDHVTGVVRFTPRCCEDALVRTVSLFQPYRVSGDSSDAQFHSTFGVGGHGPTGIFDISVMLYDEEGNALNLESGDLSALGFPTKIENMAATGDGEAPQLIDFSISPLVVDPSSGPQTVTFTVHTTDGTISDAYGAIDGAIVVGYEVENGYESVSVPCVAYQYLVSGTVWDGVYECPYQVPQGRIGLHTVLGIQTRDAASNTHFYSEADLEALSFPTEFLAGTCGNGVLDAGEVCDDGNVDDTDGCEGDCTPTPKVCGDGYQHALEECDDGNPIENDGCDANCRITGCGNEARTIGEICDDGNNQDGDGCESNCELSTGILDPSYGTGGYVQGGSESFGERMFFALQNDDSAVVQYYTYDGGVTYGRSWLTRYSSAGVLDAGFGTAGAVVTESATKDVYPGGVAVQEDGRIVAAAWSYASGSPDFRLERYLANGTLDSSFASGGVAVNPAGTGGFVQDVEIDNAGRIVVAGGIAGETLMLVRYNSNGSLDTTFGTSGKVTETAVATAASIAIQPDNKIVTLSLGYHDGGGFAWRRIAISRYLANGALDTSFGTGGRTLFPSIRTQNPPGGITVQADGKIIAAMDTSTATGAAFVAVRLNAEGSPDVSFHGDGVSAAIDIDPRPHENVHGIAVDEDGKITVAGAWSYKSIAVARYRADGTPDPDFGASGKIAFGLPGMFGQAEAIEVDSEGRLVLAVGEWDPVAGNDGSIAIVRLIVGTCGDSRAQVEDGEQCDDGNALDGDGCQNDCTLSPISQTVSAGGTVSSGTEATSAAPVVTSVTSPAGGTVTIAPATEATTDPALKIIGVELQIEAPDATPVDPLVITLTLDASAIPDGTDVTRFEVLHNGDPIGDCTGAGGTASPDPCVSDRVLLPGGDVEITVLTSSASRWSVALAALSDAEQECINRIGKAAKSVAKAQAKVNAGCIDIAYSGAGDAEACLNLDDGGKVASARQKLSDAFDDYCATLPPFGTSSAASANDGAEDSNRAIPSDLFGADIDAAVSENGERCQTGALKAAQKMFDAEAKLVLGCAKSGLSGNGQLITIGDELGACIDDLGANPKLSKAAAKLAKSIGSSCPADPSAMLPGSCAGEDRYEDCLAQQVTCRVCQLFDATWGLGVDCDIADNGLQDDSCD